MARIVRVPRDRLGNYLDNFAQRFLGEERPGAVDVEVQAGGVGERDAVSGARLVGLTYDRHADTLELALESGEHRVKQPREVWTLEEPDGFPSAMEVVCSCGRREIVRLARPG